MKGNDGTGNNESRDGWQTNQDLWNKLNEQYSFNYDCCASHDNTKCKSFASRFEEVSFVEGCAWMNPPFSKTREMFEHYFKTVTKGVAIYRCDNMETKVWQEVILKNVDWVFIPKGRISYTPFDISIRGGMTRFPSALIGFNVEPPNDIEGIVLFITK